MSANLVHIGFAKAGSHYVRAWLSAHPQIAYLPQALAGYRDVDAVMTDLASRDPLVRATSCEAFATPHERVGPTERPGHAHAEALRSAQIKVRDRLAQLFPGAFVLIVTRGFRTMILSSYSQYVRTGGALDLPTLAAQGGDARAWDYDALVELYVEAFGADRVIVLPWELMRDDSIAFFARVEAVLGLESGPCPGGRPNTSLSPASLYWYPALARAIEALPLGPKAKAKLRRGHRRLAFTDRLRPAVQLLGRLAPSRSVSPETVSEVMVERFRGQAQTLASLPAFREYALDYLFG